MGEYVRYVVEELLSVHEFAICPWTTPFRGVGARGGGIGTENISSLCL